MGHCPTFGSATVWHSNCTAWWKRTIRLMCLIMDTGHNHASVCVSGCFSGDRRPRGVLCKPPEEHIWLCGSEGAPVRRASYQDPGGRHERGWGGLLLWHETSMPQHLNHSNNPNPLTPLNLTLKPLNKYKGNVYSTAITDSQYPLSRTRPGSTAVVATIHTISQT